MGGSIAIHAYQLLVPRAASRPILGSHCPTDGEERARSCARRIPAERQPSEPGNRNFEMIADVERYRNNLRDELDGAALYEGLAAAEADPLRQDLFRQLAQAEASHAQLWRDKLTAAGIPDERFVPGLRTRLLAKLARRFGPGFVLPTVAAAEVADRK